MRRNEKKKPTEEIYDLDFQSCILSQKHFDWSHSRIAEYWMSCSSNKEYVNSKETKWQSKNTFVKTTFFQFFKTIFSGEKKIDGKPSQKSWQDSYFFILHYANLNILLLFHYLLAEFFFLHFHGKQFINVCRICSAMDLM